MTKTTRTIAMLAISAIALLGSCGKDTSKTSTSGKNNTSEKTQTGEYYVEFKGQELSNGDSIELTLGDTSTILAAKMVDGDEVEFTFESSDETVATVGVHTGLLTGVKAGTASISVYKTSDKDSIQTYTLTVKESSVSSGAVSYASASYDEKSRILAALEDYAVDNYITGITMFSNGSNICYNERYTPTPKSYITGYGWGTFREGKLSGDLSSVIDGCNKSFYQVATTSLPAHANAMNASGSDVSTVYGYISNSYYQTRLNATNDGYEWYSNTALDDRPLPIDDSGNVITENVSSLTNTRWRIHVKTGSDFVYRTASTKKVGNVSLSSFDNRAVTIEDYLTPIKYMLSCYNGQYRGAELTKGVSGFAENAAKYYAATTTKGANDTYYSEEQWKACNMDEVVKTGHDDDGDYIEFNLLQPCTQFYAMYYLSSSLYSPLPADFVNLWDSQMLGKFPDGYTPVDTMLSTGPYYITEWEKTRITFTKNENYFYKQDVLSNGNTRDVYNLPGFQYNEVEDSSSSLSLFLAGQIDSYAPNKDDLKTGGTFSGTSGKLNDGTTTWRKYETEGDATFKLNVNATSKKTWKKLFGTTGSVYPHDSTFINNSNNTFLDHRTYMSDIHFLNFLSFGMDRKTICESRGMKPTQEYFSNNYLIDPESGVSYNSTDAHKAVLADRYNDTYGYNYDAAVSELRAAMEGSIKEAMQNKEIKQVNGKYQITIVMSWMNTSDTKDYGDVFDSIETIFDAVNEKYYYGGYTLNIETPTPSSDYTDVYNKMKQGEFDLGFGAISGGDLDPINFMEVLKSDNSSGFTLNWGPDTSIISDDDQGDVVYDGKVWSYDGLWAAANTGVLLNDEGATVKVSNVSSTHDGYQYDSSNSTAQSITYKLSFADLVNAGAKANSISVQISNTTHTSSYDWASLGATEANSYVGTITLEKEFNTYKDDNGNDATATNVTVTVSYKAELDGSEKVFTTTLTLPTYAGVFGE